MTKVIYLLLLFAPSVVFSQQKLSEDEVWHKVDKPAEYPGGYQNLYNFLDKNIKYPKEAKKAKIEGKVYVSIVIDKTGQVISDSVRVVQGLGYGLDEEAIRVIKLLKPWKPAHVTEINQDVPQRIVFPISFKR